MANESPFLIWPQQGVWIYFGISFWFGVVAFLACLLAFISLARAYRHHSWANRSTPIGFIALAIALLAHGIFVTGASDWSPKERIEGALDYYVWQGGHVTRGEISVAGNWALITAPKSNPFPPEFWRSDLLVNANYAVWDRSLTHLEVVYEGASKSKGEIVRGWQWNAIRPHPLWKFLEIALAGLFLLFSGMVWPMSRNRRAFP